MSGLTEPEFDKHGSFVDVEPMTGMVINFSRKYQVHHSKLSWSQQNNLKILTKRLSRSTFL